MRKIEILIAGLITLLFYCQIKSNRLSSRKLAGVVKLVYTHALGACGATRGGSSPLSGTHWIGLFPIHPKFNPVVFKAQPFIKLVDSRTLVAAGGDNFIAAKLFGGGNNLFD